MNCCAASERSRRQVPTTGTRKGLAPMRSRILAMLFAGAFAIPGSVNAVGLITGDISLNGFVDIDFPPGSTSIVSQLTVIVSSSPALAGAGFGDYAGSAGVVTPVETIDLLDVPPGTQPLYTFSDGTEFFAQGVTSFVRNSLACVNGTCTDTLQFLLFGQVSRLGYDPTPALVRWFGQGSCSGGGDPYTCTGDASASWNARLSSPARIPEPGTFALLGLGLVGLGLSRRRKT